MPLTDADLRRLVASGGETASQIVAWLPTDAVDLTGEPGSLVLLDQPFQRALMALAQRAGACRFLEEDERCGIYSARPASCRLYPFDPAFGRRGGLRRLRLLDGTACDHARDGQNDPHQLREADARRWEEHRTYLRLIRRWNRAQGHRARLGHRVLGSRDFLSFLGFEAEQPKRGKPA